MLEGGAKDVSQREEPQAIQRESLKRAGLKRLLYGWGRVIRGRGFPRGPVGGTASVW